MRRSRSTTDVDLEGRITYKIKNENSYFICNQPIFLKSHFFFYFVSSVNSEIILELSLSFLNHLRHYQDLHDMFEIIHSVHVLLLMHTPRHEHNRIKSHTQACSLLHDSAVIRYLLGD
jgi:hypothetical protein